MFFTSIDGANVWFRSDGNGGIISAKITGAFDEDIELKKV